MVLKTFHHFELYRCSQDTNFNLLSTHYDFTRIMTKQKSARGGRHCCPLGDERIIIKNSRVQV